MKFVNKLFYAVYLILLTCSPVIAQREIDSVDDIPQAVSEFAAAYYDSNTGDIYVSVGENLLAVALANAPFGFVDGQFDPTRVQQDTPLGVPVTNNETEIAWLDAPSLLPTGIFNVGNLLPPNIGFSAAGFDDAFPDALLFFGGISPSGAGFDVQSPLNIIRGTAQAIPEPGSVGLLMVAGAFFASRRRR